MPPMSLVFRGGAAQLLNPSGDEAERRARFMLDLRHRALARRFVGAPAQQPRAVAEPAAGEMVVLHLDDELGRERLEFAGALGAPATGAAGRPAGEAGGLAQGFETFGELAALGGGDRRRETDMVQQSVVAVQAEQQGTGDAALRRIAEAAHDAIGG